MKKFILFLLIAVQFTGYAQVANLHPLSTPRLSPAPTPSISYTSINGMSTNSPIITPPFISQPFLQLQPAITEKLSIHRDPSSGIVLMIENFDITESITPEKATATVSSVLQPIIPLLGLKQTNELTVIGYEVDQIGFTHIKLQQMWNGVPVFGAQAWLHISPKGKASYNGRLTTTPTNVAVTPYIDKNAAEVMVRENVSNESAYHHFSEDDVALFKMNQYETSLVIYLDRNNPNNKKLAWHVTVRPNVVYRWEYFIDATSGAILNKFDNTCSLGPTTAQAVDLNGVTRTIGTFSASGTHFLLDASKPMYTGPQNSLPNSGAGYIATLDFQNSTLQSPSYSDIRSPGNNTWTNRAVSAHYNASVSFDYFKTKHNRNSINGNGGDVIAFINVADNDGGGLDNAFWNGQYMFYGNGRTSFFPLAGGLDVGGHEMTHGVVEATANLIYQDEPGALNESFADVFGVSIEPNDWLIGEDVVKPAAFPSGALRNLQDPHNGGNGLSDPGWQPSHINEKYTGSQDNGGVHINSGIPNRAFFLIANTIGRNKAELIYYRALASYLTKSSKFIDCRLAVVKAAEDLYGVNSTESNTAKQSFDAVGITDGSGSNTTPTLPTNPGVAKILLLNTDANDPNSIYLTDNTATNFTPISQTPVQTRPSVTDDGSFALFVGADFNIYGIELISPFNEVQLTNDAYWNSVAVSKDGARLAATSRFIDTAIWVYDIGLEQWGKFTLYNPTTGQGQNLGGVLYSDALDWSYDGTYLMYDAYNKLTGNAGQFLDYWDIGLLRAWNPATNNFNDGQIFKVYNFLEEGISIGNPSFAKNSPYIITFDYLNPSVGQYAVLGANLETNLTGNIINNNTIGAPVYNPTDSKVAFNTLNNQNKTCLAFVDVDPTKISGVPQTGIIVVLDGGYAQWFGTGNRPLSVEDEAMAQFVVYPNPTTGVLHIKTDHQKPGTTYTVFNTLGEELLKGDISATSNAIDVSTFCSGTYILRLLSDRQTSSVRFIKW